MLALPLAGATAYVTWPTRALITCESLPQLAVFAICAAVLFILSARAAAASMPAGGTASRDPWLAGASAVLALLAFFLAVHYLAVYRVPCTAVQRQLHRH